MPQQAFVLRISPGGVDRVPDCLRDDEILIGWSKAKGLLDESLEWGSFRQIVSDAFYSTESNLRKAGSAAGHLWRFINDMGTGDLVVVPYGSEFYIAKIKELTAFYGGAQADGTFYRRNVEWLNGKRPIARAFAKSALVSRMKIHGTSAMATDLFAEIEDCLAAAGSGEEPSFRDDLETKLVRETLSELRGGRLDPFGFEHLIKAVLIKLGASDANVVARNKDKGADVLATFLVAGSFQLTVAVQAKQYQPEPPVGKDVVDQLISGIEAESADLGMIITSGTISDEATSAAAEYFADKGCRIELVDGEQFAKLIVEHGVGDY